MRYHIDLPRKPRSQLLAEAVIGKPKRLLMAVVLAPAAAISGSLLVPWARAEPDIAAAGLSTFPLAVLAAALVRRLVHGGASQAG